MPRSPVDNTPNFSPYNHHRAISLINTAKQKSPQAYIGSGFTVLRSPFWVPFGPETLCAEGWVLRSALTSEPVNGYKMALLQIIQ